MRIVEHAMKEAAELLTRGARRYLRSSVPHELIALINEVKLRGFAIVENFWPAEQCAKAAREIDRELTINTACHNWIDDDRADHRLYFAERAGGELERFYADPFIESCRSFYSGVRKAETLLLAARLDFVKNNKGSGGGWHRDSPHRSQFKALMYLTDVDGGSGPFEYIEGSHLATHSVQMLFHGQCRPNQYRFSIDEVERIITAGAIRHTFTGSAGTLIVVDTKGLHRGRPIERGSRYALTQYCWDGKRPADFLP